MYKKFINNKLKSLSIIKICTTPHSVSVNDVSSTNPGGNAARLNADCQIV
jgi:hypothetical protein